MLVLTRKEGEELVIDGSIRVRVVAMQGNKVRLGVCAPTNIAVDRAEVHERRSEFASRELQLDVPAAPFVEGMKN